MDSKKNRPTTSAKCSEAKKNQHDNFSASNEAQRTRILDWLRHKSLTTLQARQHLDIMHPAARVQELREQGHNIVTQRTTENTGKAKHRIARYVLLAKEQS